MNTTDKLIEITNPSAGPNCGPTKFSSGGKALYERHVTFDQVIKTWHAERRPLQ
jgi:hypothetical protein